MTEANRHFEPSNLRMCAACGKWKAINEFAIDQSKPSGRSGKCLACSDLNLQLEARITRMCRDKKQYNSLNAALTAATRNASHFGKQHRAYSCPFCRRFHLTTTERR